MADVSTTRFQRFAQHDDKIFDDWGLGWRLGRQPNPQFFTTPHVMSTKGACARMETSVPK